MAVGEPQELGNARDSCWIVVVKDGAIVGHSFVDLCFLSITLNFLQGKIFLLYMPLTKIKM